MKSSIQLPSVETVRDWLLDSFHQHFDDIVKSAVLLLFVNGNEVAAVLLAAGAMLVSLAALLFAHKVAMTHTEHKQARAPHTFHDVQFQAETIAMLREYQAAHTSAATPAPVAPDWTKNLETTPDDQPLPPMAPVGLPAWIAPSWNPQTR